MSGRFSGDSSHIAAIRLNCSLFMFSGFSLGILYEFVKIFNIVLPRAKISTFAQSTSSLSISSSSSSSGAKRNWIEKHLKSLSEKQKSLENIEPYSDEEISSFVKKAKEIIPNKVEFYADKIGVTYNRITIRCQRTRWGSCSSKGNLNFNCLLVLLPDEIIDSVIVHELCHRKHMNHSAKFYEEVEKVFPEYRKCHEWLNRNGSKYMSRIPR